MKICTVRCNEDPALGTAVEAKKWDDYYQYLGFELYRCHGSVTGTSDNQKHLVLPEIHPGHNSNVLLRQSLIRGLTTPNEAFAEVERRSDNLYITIRNFLSGHDIRLIHVDLALAYPISLPLTMALYRLIAIDGIIALSRSLDFPWEREYLRGMSSLIYRICPAVHPRIYHMTLTQLAFDNLRMRYPNAEGGVYPSLFLFNAPAGCPQIESLRQSYGIDPSSMLLLQPSRVTFAKGIHHSVHLAGSLLQLLGGKACIFVTGEVSPTWQEYWSILEDIADGYGVQLVSAKEKLEGLFFVEDDSLIGRHTITDAYMAADIVTFPSYTEGWGNPVIESVAAKRLIFSNCFDVMKNEFLPKGFDFFLISENVDLRPIIQIVAQGSRKSIRDNLLGVYDFYTCKIPNRIQDRLGAVLQSPHSQKDIVEENWRIGNKEYGMHKMINQMSQLVQWIERHSC